jgi:hypothetical protein
MPKIEPLFSQLMSENRVELNSWLAIFFRLETAEDKIAELVKLQIEYPKQIRGLSINQINNRIKEFEEYGIESVVGKNAILRAYALSYTSASSLSYAFIGWWQWLCLKFPANKPVLAWYHLMSDYLVAGKIIPGYDGKIIPGCDSDWRSIWLSEHSGKICPDKCPYLANHKLWLHPRGWSLKTLSIFSPTRAERKKLLLKCEKDND